MAPKEVKEMINNILYDKNNMRFDPVGVETSLPVPGL